VTGVQGEAALGVQAGASITGVRTTVLLRALFALTVVSVPLQLGVARLVSEPYPGLFLPAFGAVPPDPGQRVVGVRSIEVDYADGTQVQYTSDDLFPEVELEAPMLDFAFYGERGQDPASAEWLAQRVEELGDRGPAREARLEWTRLTYSTTDDAPPTSEPEKTVVVDLDGA